MLAPFRMSYEAGNVRKTTDMPGGDFVIGRMVGAALLCAPRACELATVESMMRLPSGHPQNNGLQGDRELPEQVANALPVPASQESGRTRRARKRTQPSTPKTPGIGREPLPMIGQATVISVYTELVDLGK